MIKDRKTLEKSFFEADLNRDGRINPNEFRDMMQTIFKKKTDDDEISRLFKNFDTNKNGEITLQGKYLVIGQSL